MSLDCKIMKIILKKYLKFIIAGLVGVVIAGCSYVFIVEPSYPYLLLDKDSPVIDDATGLGYLPIEMTGASAEGAIVKHMCFVPDIYSEYTHNVVKDKNNIMSADSEFGKFIMNYSWQIIIGLLMVLGVFVVVSNYIKNKKLNKNKE